MKAYGWNSLMQKGYHYANEDVYTKGWFHGSKKHQSRRRRKHQRIFKKMERNYNKNVVRQHIKEMEEDA